ncbi:hypothetical protein EYC80_003076 [Monilinia laxa]|uniref:Uncharacterized protein n=1 Tax=Monilinia laxa TaxID=61186 RepID=A0A5N6KDV5_MONLA|nr:hypothetical protein EYC80_003076 [Monilinia laxa]
MSSGNYSGERAPPRGPEKDPRRDERDHRPERPRDTRDMQVDDNDVYDSASRRPYSNDRANGNMRSGDRSERSNRSFERTSLTNVQNLNSNNSSLRTSSEVAQPTPEGRRIEKDSRSTSKTDSISKSPFGSSDQELIKTELISAFTNLADLISSRCIMQQLQDSTAKSLKEQLEEIELMAGAMKSFPTHRNVQVRRKTEMEEDLKVTTEEINKVKSLERQAIEDITSCLIFKAPPIDHSANLEEQQRAIRNDFGSTRSRVDSDEKSLQKHTAAIDNSKQEMATLQQRISENYATIKAKDNDIEQLTRKVMDLQKLLDTHQSSFDHLNSSNHLERLNRVENTQTMVAELQSQHKTTLMNFENCQGEAPSTPAPQVMPTPSTGSNTTMIGVMQNNIRNLQRDLRNLQERSSQAPNRSLSQDAALINEQLNITRFDSRLSEVEDSMKEVRSFSMHKPAMKESPFSTTAQEHAELKKAFEIYRGEQNQTDLVTKRCVEELNAGMKATQRDNIIMNEQINSIKEKLALIPNIQDGMKELLNRLTESSIQTETRLNNRLNGIINSQNGNTMAITQLNSRMANISTADLAKNMLGQLETLYPDIRKAEATLSEHKYLLSEHTAQFAKLKSQIAVLESQQICKQSPALIDNRAPDSLRQEVDALSRDQIQLEADTKTNKATLVALEEASATMKTALDSLTKKVSEEKKRLNLMEEAFSDELAELSVKVDSLLPDNDNNTRGLAGVTPTFALPTMPSAGQSSTQETAINGKKRKVATAAESATASGSTNGYTPSPSRKRARRTEDDVEDF